MLLKHRILVVFALPLALLQAQSSRQFEGKSIVAVEYQPAVQPLDRRDLERVQIVRTGSALRSADVADAIERMFATGRYTDIRVDAEARGNGVAVRFITTPARFVGHVEPSGKLSSPPTRAQIVNAAQLNLGAPFRPELLEQAQKNIQQLFTSNGLYEAAVKLETMDDPAHDQTNVGIVIDAGVRARYETPAIHGDTKLSDSTIIRATGWRLLLIGRWRKVTDALTRRGIDSIEKKYQKKDRLTATVDLTSLDYDPESIRAKPSLDINAGPKIKVKTLEAKVSKSRLRRYVPIFEEGAVDRDLLVEGARNLRDYFQSRGYPDVDVTFRQLPPENDEQIIEYVISRGPRRKLVSVTFTGNHYFDEDTIRERLFLQPSSFRLRWGRYSEASRRKDRETIESLYKANGFRNAEVTSSVIANAGGKPGQIGVVFAIREGPQWRIAHLQLAGMSPQDAASLQPRLGSIEGEPYSDVSIAMDRALILTFYHARGYPKAVFTPYAAPAGKDQVNLTYTIQTGEQEFIRDVVITGLKTTRPKLVEHNLEVKPGDPVSLPLDRDSQQKLYDLGIFAQVDTAVQNSAGDERYKYVLFDFTEAHKYNFRLGVGAEIAQLGPTTGNLSTPTGGAGFSPRFSAQVNRINLWGIGHTVTLDTRLSDIEQRGGVNYYIPKFLNSDSRSITYSVLYDVTRDVRTFASHREEGSVQLSQRLSKPTILFFRFDYRRVSTSDVVIPALLIPQLLQPVRIGMASVNLVQDRRDNPADPHKGIYNTVDTGVASGVFGSQRSFTRILARNATYYRLTRNIVLARQLTFGAILPFAIPAGLTGDSAVPLPERFFSGGSISHRGFGENQAGPRDIGSPLGPGGTETEPTGFPLGGNALLISNVELRFPLLGENIGGVIFEDAGNVYRDVGDISVRYHQKNLQDFNYMVHAVGFGIRYKTPVGPVRFDLAYSLNPPSFAGFKGTVQDLLACNPNVAPSQLPAQCQPVVQSTGHFQFFFSIGQTF